MKAVVNLAKMPTGDVIRRRDASLEVDRRLDAIRAVTGTGALSVLDANHLAEKLMGDAVFANVIMLGFAWQTGLVPVGHAALAQAIVLNGVAVEANHRAFLLGRIAAAKPDALGEMLRPKPVAAQTLEEIIARRKAFLTDYQDAAYAGRYRRMIDLMREAEAKLGSSSLTESAAKSLFRLMAYKDEYEVARLHMETGFAARLRNEFEGDFRIVHHLAPPFLAAGTDARGRPLKRAFGPWIRLPFRLLARMKRLRGTAFDPFGRTAERRMERELIVWFEGLAARAAAEATPATREAWAAILAMPQQIRGYGPVKEEAAARARREVDAALERMKAGAPAEPKAA
jgi:indolepyruvate ferredoxin oxidoreductase